MAGSRKTSSPFTTVGNVIVLVVVVVLIRGCYSGLTGKSNSPVESADVQAPDPKAIARESTSISKFSWYKDGFGTVMKATFTIKNDGDVNVKDIEIKCVHSAPSGTVIDSNTRTIYEIIPAHKSRTFRDFDMGFIASQASNSNCVIADLALLQKP